MPKGHKAVQCNCNDQCNGHVVFRCTDRLDQHHVTPPKHAPLLNHHDPTQFLVENQSSSIQGGGSVLQLNPTIMIH